MSDSSDDEFPVENFQQLANIINQSRNNKLFHKSVSKKNSTKETKMDLAKQKEEVSQETPEASESESDSSSSSESGSEDNSDTGIEIHEDVESSDSESEQSDDESDNQSSHSHRGNTEELMNFMGSLFSHIFTSSNGDNMVDSLQQIKHSIDQNSKCILKLNKTLEILVNHHIKASSNQKK